MCRTWRDVAFSTPLRINLDYLVNLKWEAVQWLLKATFADLQVHPRGRPGLAAREAGRHALGCTAWCSAPVHRLLLLGGWSATLTSPSCPWLWPLPRSCRPPAAPALPADFHINRLLTNPDFATRNRWTLQRLWGAQLVGLPGRWPQWRHYPAIQTLELGCDSMASRNHVFESRLLAPLTQLKHLWCGRRAEAGLRALLCLARPGPWLMAELGRRAGSPRLQPAGF